MNKILCFGDGYAANHIWPEWPAIIEALYPQCQHENYGAVGAGNEFITSAVVQAHSENPCDFFIVQWASPNRFDKLLQDDTWDHIIDNDPVYHFNRVKLNNQTWWLSSASVEKIVQQYHLSYVQPLQAESRSKNFKYLVENLLKNQAIFFSLDQMVHYSNSERFKTVRLNEMQPSPVVHMAWVEEKILPKMPQQPDQKKLTELKTRINHHNWEPFHPDREEIWIQMSAI
jgi:hypothetical protein